MFSPPTFFCTLKLQFEKQFPAQKKIKTAGDN